MNYGCKKPKIDIRDYKIKAGGISLPSSFSLTNLPKVKNQLNINSCCAHATASILEYYAKNKTKLSTNFIYGMERSVCGEEAPGMYLIDACKIVQQYGDMTEADCPGNYEVPKCSNFVEGIATEADKMATAQLFKIQSYYDCRTVEDIKYAIMTYGPVLCCIYWYDDYKIVDNKGTIKFNTSSPGGYHALMLYGWDETGFYVQNSWGIIFGNGGRFILPYEYQIAEAKALIDYENENEINNLIKTKTICEPGAKLINKILNKFMIKKVK